jgi:hypothetical protein
MKDRKTAMKAFFRGVRRVQETFEIRFGSLRARGVPAVLLGVSSIIVASGVAAALSKSAARLPETLGEARGLAEVMNARLRLKS